jgi:HEAT repeat protein
VITLVGADLEPRPEFSITFTGEESDRFVRFAETVGHCSKEVVVRVVGREPITSTDVSLEGVIQSTTFEGYIRNFVIRTTDGRIFSVGGSNATMEIASSTVTFLRVPSMFAPSKLSGEELGDALKAVGDPNNDDLSTLLRIKNSSSFLSQADKLLVVARMAEAVKTLNRASREEVVDLLYLLGNSEAIRLLFSLTNDPDENVRFMAFLRIRGLEKLVKNAGEQLVEECISTLIHGLRDPCADVRTYAAEDLGYIYNSKAVSLMIDMLPAEGADHVRWAIIIALGRVNDPGAVIPVLVDRAENDSFNRVRQAALLGISRQGIAVWERNPGVRELLDSVLKAGEEDERSYAAYALGQIGQPSVACVGSLIQALTDTSLAVRSNACLALVKLSDWIPESREPEIRSSLEQLSGPDFRKDTSPYYYWYLEYTAQLASAFEWHDFASECFFRLSGEYSDWRRPYYSSLAKYELAESSCEHGNLEESSRLLSEADKLIKEHKDFPLDAGEGIQFRRLVIDARKNMIEGLQAWDVAVGEDYAAVKAYFNRAFRIYSLISLPRENPSPENRRLTKRERGVLNTLKFIAFFGVQFSDIRLATQKGDLKTARSILDDVDASVNELIRSMGPDSTAYLHQLVQKIRSEVSQMLTSLNTDSDRISPARVFQEGINAIKNAYLSTAFPSIAIGCPVAGLGKAYIIFRIFGGKGGDGSDHSHPLLFPCDVKLVINVEVRVEKRTRAGDRLVFAYKERNGKDMEQDVPVSEGPFGPIKLDYGLVPPSYTPLDYAMTLTFKGPHCEQEVDKRTIWIQTFDPKTNPH